MKRFLLLFIVVCGVRAVQAQSLDSLYFNLYVDSLKKGTFNYINVEGRFSNGNYLPLTTDDLEFSCDSARFDRNSLFIDLNFRPRFVKVTAIYRKDRSKKIEKLIPIRQFVAEERLKTEAEVMKERRRNWQLSN